MSANSTTLRTIFFMFAPSRYMALARLKSLSRGGLGTIISRAFARLTMVGGDGFEPPTLSV